MISYAQPKLWQRPWVMLLTLGALVLVVTIWWPQDRRDAGEPAPTAQTNPLVRSNVGLPTSLPPLHAKLPDDGSRPSDFTAEEWSTLQSASAESEQPRRELARLVGYLRFQKGFALWQSMHDSPDVATRHRLAEQLLTQLPERLRQGELGAGEVTLLQQALLADLIPDEALRQQRLTLAQAELAQAMRPVDSAQQAQDEAKHQEYKRREAAIVADYQARPEGQRSPSQLESALEDARRAVYQQSH